MVASATPPDAALAFVEDLALLLTESGVPRMPARVFACVLAADAEGLTAGELAERLRVSPAAISGAVRYLMQVHLISREREPGGRRDHYRLLNDVWYEVTINREPLLRRWERQAAEGVEVLGADTPAGRRMADTLEFFSFLLREMPLLIARWHATRA